MIKEILTNTCFIVAYSMLCGFFIEMAIKHFKKEEYFAFGTSLTLAIGEIVHITKYIWFR